MLGQEVREEGTGLESGAEGPEERGGEVAEDGAGGQEEEERRDVWSRRHPESHDEQPVVPRSVEGNVQRIRRSPTRRGVRADGERESRTCGGHLGKVERAFVGSVAEICLLWRRC